MKKLFAVILAFIYLGVSSGIALNVHYCMNRITSVDLFHHSNKCDKCGMKTANGCCRDEFKLLKLNDSHKIVANDVNIFAPVALINNTYTQFKSSVCITEVAISSENESPPQTGRSICILNSVFRI